MENPTNILKVHTYTISDFEGYYYIKIGTARVWVHPELVKRTSKGITIQFPLVAELKTTKDLNDFVLTLGVFYTFLVTSPCATRHLAEITVHSDHEVITPTFPIWISGEKNYPIISARLVTTKKDRVIYSIKKFSSKYKMLKDGTIEEYFSMDFSEIKEKLELKEG